MGSGHWIHGNLQRFSIFCHWTLTFNLCTCLLVSILHTHLHVLSLDTHLQSLNMFISFNFTYTSSCFVIGHSPSIFAHVYCFCPLNKDYGINSHWLWILNPSFKIQSATAFLLYNSITFGWSIASILPYNSIGFGWSIDRASQSHCSCFLLNKILTKNGISCIHYFCPFLFCF